MFSWLANLFSPKSPDDIARKAFIRIDELGGADFICFISFNYWYQNQADAALLMNGELQESRFPFQRTIMTFAGITSYMLARKDLLTAENLNEIDIIRGRRYCAKDCIIKSHLMLSEAEWRSEREKYFNEHADEFPEALSQFGLEPAAKVKLQNQAVRARLKQGIAALNEWRSADVSTFPTDRTIVRIDAGIKEFEKIQVFLSMLGERFSEDEFPGMKVYSVEE